MFCSSHTSLLPRTLLTITLVFGVWCTPLSYAVGDGYDWPGKRTRAAKLFASQRVQDKVRALETLTTFTPRDATPYVLQALQHTSPDVRSAALNVVRALRLRSVYPALRPLLSDPDASVRQRALEALSTFRDPKMLADLSRGLSDAKPDVRVAAVRGLTELNTPESRAALVEALHDKSLDVVQSALHGVSASHDLGALFAVVEKAQSQSSFLRLSAVETLGKLGDWRATEPILARLYDTSPEVQLAAVQALGVLRDPSATRDLIRFLRTHHQTFLGAHTATALGRIQDPRAAEILLETVYAKSAASFAAVDALKELGPSVSPAVLRALKSSRDSAFQDACLRVLSFYAMGSDPKHSGTRALLQRVFLRELDAERYPQTRVVDILAHLGGPDVVERFVYLLASIEDGSYQKKHGSPTAKSVLWRVLSSFSTLKDTRLTPLLMSMFDEVELPHKVLLLKAFASIADPESTSLLKRMLSSTEPRIREEATRALIQVKTPETSRVLLDLVQGHKTALRLEIAEGLARGMNPTLQRSLVRMLDAEDTRDRHFALHTLAEALRQGGGEPQELRMLFLRKARVVSDPDVHARVLHALRSVALADVKDVRAVWSTFQKSPHRNNAELTRAALALAGDWRTEKSFVLEALHHAEPKVRMDAAWSLAEFSGAEVSKALVGLLGDVDPHVVINATGALVYAGVLRADREEIHTLLKHPEDAVVSNTLLALEGSDQGVGRATLLELIRTRRSPEVLESAARIFLMRKLDVDTVRAILGRELSQRITAHMRAMRDPSKDIGSVRVLLSDRGRPSQGQRVRFKLPNSIHIVQESGVFGEVHLSRIPRGQTRIVPLGGSFRMRSSHAEKTQHKEFDVWSGI